MNSFLKRHLNAILSTVILHLVIAVIFMFTKVSGIKEQNPVIEFEFDKKEVENQDIEKEQEKLQKLAEMAKMVDKMVAAQNRSNIAVNVSDKVKEEISTEKYIEQLKGQLNDGRPAETNAKEVRTTDVDNSKPSEANMNAKVSPKHDKPGIYSGPTNIYYDLEGRRDVYMPIPVYKCQSMGKIVINISVARDGMVISASVNKSESHSDECLQSTALTYAKRTRFNALASAPEPQKGLLTYVFVAQ